MACLPRSHRRARRLGKLREGAGPVHPHPTWCPTQAMPCCAFPARMLCSAAVGLSPCIEADDRLAIMHCALCNYHGTRDGAAPRRHEDQASLRCTCLCRFTAQSCPLRSSGGTGVCHSGGREGPGCVPHARCTCQCKAGGGAHHHNSVGSTWLVAQLLVHPYSQMDIRTDTLGRLGGFWAAWAQG